jgi:uncharacterized protein YecT (DUF1311 family)
MGRPGVIGIIALVALVPWLAIDAAAGECDWAMTETDMEGCWAKQRDLVQADLERDYAAVLKELEGNKRELAVKAQVAWERYRDAQCAASIAEYEGGSIVGLQAITCRWKAAHDRLSDLRSLYERELKPPASSFTSTTHP